MKTAATFQTFNQNKTFKLLASLAVLALLTSCGTSKSNQINTLTNSSTNILTGKPLANCQKTANTDISVNMSAVVDQVGTPDLNWTKLKFNFLSTTMAASGNNIRFYKWRVLNGQSYMDQTALSTAFYDLSTGQQTTSTELNVIPTSSITPTKGIYIRLNDSQGAFQVLKIVVTNSTGQIVGQMNTLIPQFLANPADYVYNTDGTARAQILVDMHPLKNTDTTSWVAANYTAYFQGHCF